MLFCCFFRIQFRFGWSHWGDRHGLDSGSPYTFYLSVGEYIVSAAFKSRLVVDYIFFKSNLGKVYKIRDGSEIDADQDLGSELAYLAGYTHSQFYGLRPSDIAVYQTKCY